MTECVVCSSQFKLSEGVQPMSQGDPCDPVLTYALCKEHYRAWNGASALAIVGLVDRIAAQLRPGDSLSGVTKYR